jgi:putative phage-type endonuclease
MPEIVKNFDSSRKAIVPQSKEDWLELRSPNINSTDVAALFGLSPHKTLFELWHEKKNQVRLSNNLDENERVKWGKRLEESIARGIAEDNHWTIREMSEYIFDTTLRAGSSFDFEIVNTKEILEIKNVDSFQFKQGWIHEEDQVEAPPHIELQVQHQLLLAEREAARIGALIGGNQVVCFRRTRSDTIIGSIVEKIQSFWESIEKNEEPSPDFARDFDLIKKIYSHAEAGKVIDFRSDEEFTSLGLKHKELDEKMKALKLEKDKVNAEMRILCGDAEKILGDGFSISAGLVEPSQISYLRKEYRNFRLNWSKK